MTLTYTKYYRFPKTDFMSEPWIQGVWDSFDAIDALMYGQATTNGTSMWRNSYQYNLGIMVIDPVDASTWICVSVHTSAALPTTMAQDRAAHPTYWNPIMLAFIARGQWTNNTSYNVNDMAYDTTAGRNMFGICKTKHTSNAAGNMNDDAAFWAFTYNSMAPQTAAGIGYDNSVSHLVATTVQAAIDEVVVVKAPIASPAFTGNPTAPTPTAGDNDTSVATTAFVQTAVSTKAPIASPIFTGDPTAPTPAPGDNDTSVATTAFVQTAISSKASLVSPIFTGDPTAPTPAPGDNDTSIATTAFVSAAISTTVATLPPPIPPATANPLMDGAVAVGAATKYAREDHIHPSDTSRAATVHTHAESDVTNLVADLALKAPLNSPTFTGTPTAPTLPSTDNSAKLATTAFVQSVAITGGGGGGSGPPSGTILPLINATPAVVGVSTAYAHEDHVHPTDTSRYPVTNPNGYQTAAQVTASLAPYYLSSNPSGYQTAAQVTASLVPYYLSSNPAGYQTAAQVATGDNLRLAKAANLSDVADAVAARQNIYAAPFDALAYNGIQINGSMEVSQERGSTTIAGSASFTGFICDGWAISANGTMAVVAGQFGPIVPGILNNLAVSISTAEAVMGAGDYVMVNQNIEGFRAARLWWGSPSAQPLTIGFWTAHHRTGTYTVSVRNSAATRSYPATYTQNVADTPEYKVVTIPGDTAGVWNVDNTTGLSLLFAMACGTTYTAPANAWAAGNFLAAPGQVNAAGATTDVFRLTGVVVLPGIEAPSAARLSFIMRPFDQELTICKRYWRQSKLVFGPAFSTSAVQMFASHDGMRAAPTARLAAPLVLANLSGGPGAGQSAAHISFSQNTADWGQYNFDQFTTLVSGNLYIINTGAANPALQLDARL